MAGECDLRIHRDDLGIFGREEVGTVFDI